MVQEKCQITWDAILLAFRSVDPIIDCNDTSSVLFPIPHCCTGAGLGVLPLALIFIATVTAAFV